jgi:tetratricopeptide (TPR) repeat protein
MDWITVLRSLQSDFINRLSSGSLLRCQNEGQYSELTIISGERLMGLRNFCWQMAEKYKRVSPVRDVFISFLKGKLGEEVVKERLASLITEVDYEKRIGGDGNVDFTLNSNPLIGIEVKSRCGTIDKVRWSVSSEEVEKNAVIVCVLIQENVNEAQSEYNLILAGFLPTEMVKLRTGRIAFGIDQLLYGGGLVCYLQQLQSSQNHAQYQHSNRDKLAIYQYATPVESNGHGKSKYEHEKDDFQRSPDELIALYLQAGNDSFERGNYEMAIISYQGALKLNNNAEFHYKIACARYQLGDYEGTISDCMRAININPNHLKAYQKSGLARYQISDSQGAIADFSEAIRINPHDTFGYINRAYARSQLGDNQGAIEDYSFAIKLNPNADDGDSNLFSKSKYFLQAFKVNPQDAEGYKNRANSRYDMADYQGAITDYSEALKLNPGDIDTLFNRANARYDLGDKEGAIEDYNQVIKINPDDADAYFYRGSFRCELGDKLGAVQDFQKATELYRKLGKLVEHRNAKERILDLEIEASLDVLNF